MVNISERIRLNRLAIILVFSMLMVLVASFVVGEPFQSNNFDMKDENKFMLNAYPIRDLESFIQNGIVGYESSQQVDVDKIEAETVVKKQVVDNSKPYIVDYDNLSTNKYFSLPVK